ncbi:MAG: Eco29kI family restriction endonuclease [Microlunatus sp.]|nr:Eco29kI family restriction endonuclease [Microlunatus sp.]
MSQPFNPLDMDNLAHSIVIRMLETEPTPLDSVPRFTGAGLYAIYYSGGFPAYAVVSETAVSEGAAAVPLYVGKAVPSGGRRGLDVTAHSSTRALANRIREHAGSVRATENLDIDDFTARWLVVEDIWIPLGESALIRRYRPVWNALLDGFGNHDPGRGRIAGIRSRWDTLHPGRSWVVKYPERTETAEEIAQDVREYLRARAQ